MIFVFIGILKILYSLLESNMKFTMILLTFGVIFLSFGIKVAAQVVCDGSQATMDLSTEALNLQLFLDVSNKLNKCTQIDAKYGMMRLEAFLYALSLVNSNQTMLHRKKLGAIIYDTCKNPNREFICSVGNSVTGVVGPENSETAQIGSVVYTSFTPRLSLISYGATSEYLNDKLEYSNLFHTIPSDESAYEALTDVARFFNWTYIGVLHTHKSVGDGMATFKRISSKKGLCIKFSATTKKVMDDNYLFNLLKPLRLDSKLEVLYILLADSEAKTLLNYLERNVNSYKHLNLIGGQKLGTRLGLFPSNKTIGVGVLTIEVESPKVLDFEKYYLNLRPENNTRNTFFKKFWEETFNCSVDKSPGKVPCSGQEKLKEGIGFYENAPVMPVINAVLSFGNAIGKAIVERCSSLSGANNTACLNENITSETLQTQPYLINSITKHLPSVSFTEPTEAGKVFSFDANYRRNTNYVIYNTQLIGNNLRYQKVGLWENINSSLGPRHSYTEKLAINISLIKWRNGKIPLGKCSNECDRNQVKIFDRYLSCCWNCKTCSKSSIIVNNTCKACKLETWPDTSLKTCVTMPKTGINAKAGFSIAIVIFSIFFIFLTLFVILVYLRNFDKRAIKATNRELSLIVLFGIVIVFITSLVFLAQPSSLVCNTQQCLLGTGLVLCGAPLFMKTMTLYRIVQKASTTAARPKLAKCRSQLLVCLGLVCIQFLMAALWVQGNSAKIQNYVPRGKIYVVIHCQFSFFGLVVNIVYPVILMGLAVIFAMRTRNMKIPREVNEARYITVAMSLTGFMLLIYLIAFSVYERGKENFTQEYTISVVYFFVGVVNLTSIFIPRIIYLYCPVEDGSDPSRTATIVSADVFHAGQLTPVQDLRRNGTVSNRISSASKKPVMSIMNRTATVSPQIIRSYNTTTNAT